MKKIRLDLDSLKVESFVTNENSGGQGTVFGMDPNTICDWTCNGVSPSCDGGPQGCPTLDTDPPCDYTLPMETTCYTTYPTGTGGHQSQLGTCETCDESCGEATCEPCAESCDSEPCEPD